MKLYFVDAFTNKAFAGNPAVVCILDAEPTDFFWMQSIGAEMNQSETCFVWPLKNDAGAHSESSADSESSAHSELKADWGLRWFTPAVEIQLCGHATLASAHILWSEGFVELGQEVRFFTPMAAHYLNCSFDQETQNIRMSFPAMSVENFDLPDGMPEALGTDVVSCNRNANGSLLLELENAQSLMDLQPDFHKLMQATSDVVIVTALSDRTSEHVVSRFFAPGKGINEDPVTGSAHCIIGPYWGDRLGRSSLVCYQASKRGGVLNLDLEPDRVYISGKAITVLSGELHIEPFGPL